MAEFKVNSYSAGCFNTRQDILLLLNVSNSNSKYPTDCSSFVEIKSVSTHSRRNVVDMEQSTTRYYTKYYTIDKMT